MADPATAIRELMGSVMDDHDTCFDRNDILRVFDLPHVDITATPKHVYVSVDPCGGGASKMAITSGYYDEELNFIVSLFHFIHNHILNICLT